MPGVTNHVSDLKRRMAWMNNFKNVPDVLASEPSHTRIYDIHSHFFLDLFRLDMTAGQSYSVAKRRRPGDLNALKLARGWS